MRTKEKALVGFALLRDLNRALATHTRQPSIERESRAPHKIRDQRCGISRTRLLLDPGRAGARTLPRAYRPLVQKTVGDDMMRLLSLTQKITQLL